MDNEKKYKSPEVNHGDAGYAVVKAGISSLPILGAFASELLGLIVTPPLEKRKLEWMELVGEGLRELEQKMNIILEELPNSDKFIDAAMDATQISLRTSQKEKLDALRNALLNSALPHSAEDSIQKMFFSFIDIFTVFHLKILELFDNPGIWLKKHDVNIGDINAGALSHIVEKAFPELDRRRSFYDQIWKDLNLRGLVSTESLHGMMTGGGLIAKRTTKLGEAFLKFISNPLRN